MLKDKNSNCSVIREVSSYISRSEELELPAEVISKAKHHILDTLSAIVSGSKLKPGLVARKYAESLVGMEDAQVIGSPVVTSAINAAFINGVMAHADETDDSHARSLTHPGCAIVPAALAMSEREGADGMSFLKAVVAGYDIGCRITQALWPDNIHRTYHSTHSIGGNFGAAAAAAAVLRLKDDLVRYVLSYAAQQASGVVYWLRDEEHMEKAFVFGGMPARNGITAAILVQTGFTGVGDPFSDKYNFFETFSTCSRPELLLEGLGSHYEIMFTNIKKFSVGSPIQAALDALLLLIQKYGFRLNDLRSIVVRLPHTSAHVVDNRDMPDINLQYLLAVTLVDGSLTFEASHSYKRMLDPAVLKIRKRIELVDDTQLSGAKREAIVEVVTKYGSKFEEHVMNVRGTVENPMTPEEVRGKCGDLLTPILGEDRTQKLINRIWNLEELSNVRDLRPLISAP